MKNLFILIIVSTSLSCDSLGFNGDPGEFVWDGKSYAIDRAHFFTSSDGYGGTLTNVCLSYGGACVDRFLMEKETTHYLNFRLATEGPDGTIPLGTIPKSETGRAMTIAFVSVGGDIETQAYQDETSIYFDQYSWGFERGFSGSYQNRNFSGELTITENGDQEYELEFSFMDLEGAATLSGSYKGPIDDSPSGPSENGLN